MPSRRASRTVTQSVSRWVAHVCMSSHCRASSASELGRKGRSRSARSGRRGQASSSNVEPGHFSSPTAITGATCMWHTGGSWRAVRARWRGTVGRSVDDQAAFAPHSQARSPRAGVTAAGQSGNDHPVRGRSPDRPGYWRIDGSAGWNSPGRRGRSTGVLHRGADGT
jgi:hypothetical protein